MSEKLKPCPYCGDKGENTHSVWHTPMISCMNSNCSNFRFSMPLDEWQLRPAEDALNRQILALKIELGCMHSHINELYLLLVDNPQTRKLADAIYVRIWTRYVREMKELK